jgi:hypothetical protein
MKLFECDLCPRRLQCKLKSKKDAFIKKWWGDENFKRFWDDMDKTTDLMNMCRVVGYHQGIGAAVKHFTNKDNYFDKMWDDIKDCIMQKVHNKYNEEYEKRKKREEEQKNPEVKVKED